jgi:hypothetical protein
LMRGPYTSAVSKSVTPRSAACRINGGRCRRGRRGRLARRLSSPCGQRWRRTRGGTEQRAGKQTPARQRIALWWVVVVHWDAASILSPRGSPALRRMPGGATRWSGGAHN